MPTMEILRGNSWSFYAQLLQRCGESRDTAAGIAAHREIQRLGMDRRDTYIGNLLVQMYGKCGDVEEAMAVFQRMEARNVYSWTIAMDACLENGLGEVTLKLFRGMLLEGIRPDRVAFLSALKACSKLSNIGVGQELENLLVSVLPACFDPAVLTALLNMYASCGSLENAMRVFQSFQKDLVSWNSMLSAYAKLEKGGRPAVEFFRKMLLEGVKPNAVSFTCVVGVCSRPEVAGLGCGFHEQIVSSGLDADSFLAAALVNMYSKSGRLDSARALLRRDHVKKSLIPWNSLLAAHAQRGDFTEVLEVFGMLQLEGLKPSAVTLISVLGACCSISIRALKVVEHLRERIQSDGEFLGDMFLGTALMTALCECGKLADAEFFFYRSNWNTAGWNTMISGYVQHGYDQDALHLFCKMDVEGIKPNAVTFLGIVDACSSLAVLENGKAIHKRISGSNTVIDAVLGTAIVNMYANCESLENSRQVFEALELKDTVSWNAIIACHTDVEAALFSKKMDLEGVKPDRNTFTVMLAASTTLQQGESFMKRFHDTGYKLDDVAVVSLIELYGRFGDISAARNIFDRQENKTVVSWTAMVAVYMTNENGTQEAWPLFQRMNLEGVRPNSVTFISLLGSNCGFLLGKKLHELITSSAELTVDPVVAAALMNTYAKAGNIQSTREVFQNMQGDGLCWNSLLRAYAEQAHPHQVLESFYLMIQQGLKPNNDTFIFVLHACSHAGTVHQACELFSSITRDHNLVPVIQHYVCLIDLLGRAGWVENAHDLVNKMPYQPNSLAWSTLLGACGMYGDAETGSHAAQQVTEIDADHPGASYVLFSNILASTGYLTQS